MEMTVNFRIPIFAVNDDKLVKREDRIFKINFIHGSKWNRFRICVDGKLSNQTISFLDYNKSKKEKYLEAIKFVLFSQKNLSQPSKFLTDDGLKSIYTKGILKSIHRNLLETTTEQRRDVLSKYNLVFIESQC